MDVQEARAAYRALRQEAIELDPTMKGQFNKLCTGKADHLARLRLRANYRYYTGPNTARRAKEKGLEYPAESLPTHEEYLQAARGQVDFLRWAAKTL